MDLDISPCFVRKKTPFKCVRRQILIRNNDRYFVLYIKKTVLLFLLVGQDIFLSHCFSTYLNSYLKPLPIKKVISDGAGTRKKKIFKFEIYYLDITNENKNRNNRRTEMKAGISGEMHDMCLMSRV
jgi:hypothetical protein